MIDININRRSRSDLYRFVTPDYYGYRDDDDGILKIKELEREVIFQMANVLRLIIISYSIFGLILVVMAVVVVVVIEGAEVSSSK